MIKILLDTNLLIYREDHSIIDEKVLELTKVLYDSNKYKIVIHPATIEDLSHIKDSNDRDIFYSKVKIYNIIEKPPKATDNFNKLVGCSKLPNDLIDNNILYAVYRDCVSYLITNDKKLKNKAKKANIDDRVLNIEDAINLFKPLEEKEIRTPAFIQHEYLYNIELEDVFFSSLKADYKGFEDWYKKKAREGKKAYITRDTNNNIGSFLMIKIEDQNEDYSKFKIPFQKDIRLKIATFKVANTGNKIGESYIKIIINEAIKNNVNEIYVTVFKKQEALIKLFCEYGFIQKTTQMTEKADSSFEEELIFVKSMSDNTYPNFDWSNKNTFIVPIQQQYHEMLFPESESLTQLSFDDLQGANTYSNTIKKAYICKAKTKQIKPGDILLFYASEYKKSITTIGIVDNVFSGFSTPEELYTMATKRTVYSLEEIKSNFTTDSKLILFKYYKTLINPITYKKLVEDKILKNIPMSIVKVDSSKIKKLVNC
ncbi:MAG: EVE domain-containing protein [Bacilli bacterium]